MSEPVSHTITSACLIRENKVLSNDQLIVSVENESADFTGAAYKHLGIHYPRFFKMDVLCKLGIIAADVLLKEVNIQQYSPEEVGIVLSNFGGSIEADLRYFESSKTFPSPSLFVYTLPNIVVGEISIRYGIKGESAFFISRNFDAHWLHFYVTNRMSSSNMKACLCGWVEAMNNQLDACFFWVETDKANGVNFIPEALHNYYHQ